MPAAQYHTMFSWIHQGASFYIMSGKTLHYNQVYRNIFFNYRVILSWILWELKVFRKYFLKPSVIFFLSYYKFKFI
jgi:hypothetical protein